MSYLGSWAIDDNLTFTCNTHAPATGAATDADAVPAYRVYEDETGAAILTGNMAKLDDANTTGFYSEQIALTAANGLEVGKCYSVYISAAVGAVTGTISHTFQMLAEVNIAQISGDGTAADNLELDYDGAGYAKANSTVGTATAVTNQVTADVTAISGDAAAANNAESFFDGTGYAGTNNVIPTVTTVGTTTTLTDVTDITQRQIPDSVAADGVLPTIEQALYEIVQYLNERSVSGTTVTVNKVDGSTGLMTFTLNDATNPTSITRAS